MGKETNVVLIVDDEPLTLKILRSQLSPIGCQIVDASNGPDALKKAEEKPDLILLDILLPGMDGIETCKRLKENESTKDIPVILISALDDIKILLKGFDVGAVDYVGKPFNTKELLSRVKAQLTIRNQELQLKEYATQLEHMVEERTRQLIQADRLAVLGTFSAAIFHEINNAATAIIGSLDLVKPYWTAVKQFFEQDTGESSMTKANEKAKKLSEMLQIAFEGSSSLLGLVERFKTYSKKGETEKKKSKLGEIVNNVQKFLHYRLKRGVSVEVSIPPEIAINCHSQEISQVFINLFNNAIDAMVDNKGKIFITAQPSGDSVGVTIADNGPGIPADVAKEIFNPFFTTKGKEQGTGLGLFIVKNIVEDHGGNITLLVGTKQGAAFKITFPLAE
jgi:C4-dicarboxylate-specific signal transduction histidine kinase